MLEKAAADIDLAEYTSRIDLELRASDKLYAERLSTCQECEYLVSGLCRACGCYVEIRALTAAHSCPYNKW